MTAHKWKKSYAIIQVNNYLFKQVLDKLEDKILIVLTVNNINYLVNYKSSSHAQMYSK